MTSTRYAEELIRGWLSFGPGDAEGMLRELELYAARDNLNAALAKLMSEGIVNVDVDFFTTLAS